MFSSRYGSVDTKFVPYAHIGEVSYLNDLSRSTDCVPCLPEMEFIIVEQNT